jgi:hypothetical protein
MFFSQKIPQTLETTKLEGGMGGGIGDKWEYWASNGSELLRARYLRCSDQIGSLVDT